MGEEGGTGGSECGRSVFVGCEVKAVDGEVKTVEVVGRGRLGELFGAVIIGGPA